MNSSRFVRLSAIGLSVIVLMLFAAAPFQAQEGERYTPGDCPEAFAQLPVSVECGSVSAPLYHDDPSAGSIELAVFVMRASGDAPSPEPLVMLQGGPGGSVETLVFVAASGMLGNLTAERDLVFIEQRGNLYSRPNLTCPTYTRMFTETLGQTVDPEQVKAAELTAVSACLDEFRAAQIDLAAFDSYENARDIPLVVLDALGYTAYHLYGVSYGSLLAQHVMEIAPRGLRSVILDAVVPRDVNPDDQSIDFGWRSLSLLFAACAADEMCSSQHPALQEMLFDLLARLDAEPATITITDMRNGAEYPALLNGSRLAIALFNSLYDSAGLRRIPNEIARAATEGDLTWAAQALSSLLDSSFSVGMQLAVNCAEHVYSDADPVVSPEVPVLFAQALQAEAGSTAQVCRLISVPVLPDEASAPADEAVPVLLLSGEFDPITPPVYGDRVAETLPNAVHVVFGGVSHGALLGGGRCPVEIALAFLNDPESEPDTSCAQQMRLQFTQTFDLVDHTSGTFTVGIPEGWTQIQPDVFTDGGSIVLAVGEFEGAVLDDQFTQFFEDMLSETERLQVQLGMYTWRMHILRLEDEGMYLFVAGTETDAHTYMVLSQGSLSEFDVLLQDLLFPVLGSFTGQ
jgi:pimeloyl-ACP methyl ester carboxylesterase